MRLFGRTISRWWLLLTIPLVVLGAPVLLILFFAGNNLAGAILGPPAIWNRPSGAIQPTDLVGKYVETKRRSEWPKFGPGAVVELYANGTMQMSNLDTSCTSTGTGRWQVMPDQKVAIHIESGQCETWIDMEIVGRSKPYGFYEPFGDPDSGNGMWLERR